MKVFFLLASLFACAAASDFSISVPTFDATVQAGQNMDVQILVGPDALSQEVSLIFGIFACGGTSPCPPVNDLGEILYFGKFQSQGPLGIDLFQNFSLHVPNTLSGKAFIEVCRVFVRTEAGLTTYPFTRCASQEIFVNPMPTVYNIHPNGDDKMCIGIFGGAYVNGAAVDIYDCDGSKPQKWRFDGGALFSVSDNGSKWCLDAGVMPTWANGVKMKIWQCIPGVPQQAWAPFTSPGHIVLNMDKFCLDLTDGSKMNRNILQIWNCGGGKNQIWTTALAT